MLSKEEIKDRVKSGWIHSRMTFEVMATQGKVAEESLASHIKKLKQAPDSEVISEKFEDVLEVLPPPKNVERAFSQIAEVEILSKSIESMLLSVVTFAPSSVEVLEPQELQVSFSTIQSVMNTISDMMHRYAAQGAGGIVISTLKQQ